MLSLTESLRSLRNRFWRRRRVPAPIQRGQIKIGLKIVARDPDGEITGTYENPDLATKQLAQFIQALILATTQTTSVKDTGGSNRTVTNGDTTGTVTILAGTSSTGATVTDNSLGTQTETVSGTVNAYSGSGSSGSFTVTGTITATADRAYAEVGLRITSSTFTFLLCRDQFSTLNVSNTGTLAVTYTITLS